MAGMQSGLPVRTSNRAPWRGHWISQPVELALGQRPAVVGADVVDRVEAPSDVEQGDGPAVDLDAASCRPGGSSERWATLTGSGIGRSSSQ